MMMVASATLPRLFLSALAVACLGLAGCQGRERSESPPEAGAVVVAAEDGEQGLDALHRSVADAEPFHVVVSDLRLPRGTGAAVLRAAQVAWPEASLVAMSGFLEDDDVARMAAAQVLVFLPKPFTAVQFGHAVAEARAPRG